MLPPINNSVSRTECLSLTTNCIPLKPKKITSILRISAVASSGFLFSAGHFPRPRDKKLRKKKRVAATISGAFGSPERRMTDSLIILNMVMFGLQTMTGSLLVSYGAKINQMILRGQYWRFITSAFLHGDLLHLAFNCNALHQIGPLVETMSGRARFVAIYLGSAAAGSFLSFLMSPITSLGASGAIFGTASALAMFAWRHKELMGPSADKLLVKLRDTAMINFMYGLVIRRIDNWGHLGGLIGGAVLSYLLGPNLKPVFRDRKVIRVEDKPLLPILATKRPRTPK